jgi:hypothetical protein
MSTYEIHISNVVMMVEASDEDNAISVAEAHLMESCWDYGSIEVA